jgi:hypothetical protein
VQTSHPTPLQPPPWATRTVAEDEWITHETVSTVHPRALIHWPPIEPSDVQPVQVSVSVVDRWMGGRWVRSEPTVQVEAGAYPLSEVAELLRALGDLARLSGYPPAA